MSSPPIISLAAFHHAADAALPTYTHTDYGNVTMLATDEVARLEVNPESLVAPGKSSRSRCRSTSPLLVPSISRHG